MKIIINQANEDSNFKQEANNYLSGYLFNELHQKEKSVLFISEFSFLKNIQEFSNLNLYYLKNDETIKEFNRLKSIFFGKMNTIENSYKIIFFKYQNNSEPEQITFKQQSFISGTWNENILANLRSNCQKMILEFNNKIPDKHIIETIKNCYLCGYEIEVIINCSKTEQNDKQLLEILEKLKDELGELELITINRNQINKQFIKKCVIKL